MKMPSLVRTIRIINLKFENYKTVWNSTLMWGTDAELDIRRIHLQVVVDYITGKNDPLIHS